MADPVPPPVDTAEAERRLRAWLDGQPGEWGRREITGVVAALDEARAELAEMETLAASLGVERLDALAQRDAALKVLARCRAQRDAVLALAEGLMEEAGRIEWAAGRDGAVVAAERRDAADRIREALGVTSDG